MKIITISGASGSGKTTLAHYIHNSIANSLFLSIDRYYLSKAEQIEKNGFFDFDDPASLDLPLLKKHLSELKSNGSANVPIYDFTISARAGYEEIHSDGLIIIDGLFAGSLLKDISDLDIFVDVDLDLALLRRIDRDMKERDRTLDSVTEQYMRDVRPAFFKHIKPIKSSADIVISNNHGTDKMIKEAEYLIPKLS
jgi:uridine kinase